MYLFQDIQDQTDIKKFRLDEMRQRLDTLISFELDDFRSLEREAEELFNRKSLLVKRLDEINRKSETISERREIMRAKEKDVVDAKGNLYCHEKRVQ